MKRIFRLISKWYKSLINFIKPNNNEIKGASHGLWIITILLWTLTIIFSLLQANDIYVAVLLIALLGLSVLSSRLASFVIKKVHFIPQNYKLTLFAVIPLLIIAFAFSYLLAISIIIVASIIGASAIGLRSENFKKFSLGQKIFRISGMVIGVVSIAIAIILYSVDGFDSEVIVNAALKSNNSIQLTSDNPGRFGNYDVEVLYYGSGQDKHRSEFADEVDIKTDSIDGTPFIDNWSGFSGWYRTNYWGFDEKALPLNARVWYPKGKGKFPLVLVVHGNHYMQDYSDPGYDYLGELIASRGFILASIDENFINSSWSDFIDGLKTENDARAWLLLEHLKLWHQWNKDTTNVFYNMVDTNNIALIGHSRGGEAVAHAACFNKLPYYPDDADIKFDYNFNIRSIVAIAPCDGQYKPASNKTNLENIDYFVLHGAQDSDVRSFMGSQQYERVKFTDNEYHFKTGIYIYGANHGQFNTTWGRNDVGLYFNRLYNLRPLMTEEEQRNVAKTYISAFLETTLKKNYSYIPMFMDYRTAKDWLPETIYLNQFQDSNSEFICTFDEDINLVTSTNNNATTTGENLTVWKEKLVNLKWGNKGTRALYLGWNSVKDSTKLASYTLDIKNNEIETDSTYSLIFSMADADEDSNPKSHGKWLVKNKDNTENTKEENDLKKEENEDEVIENEIDKVKGKDPINFTIFMEDILGHKIKFPLSSFSYLQPKLKVMLMKTDFINNKKQSENIFQLFKFPFKKLRDKKIDFDFNNIQRISFIFNKTKEGVVIIDNIGFMKEIASN